MSKKRGRTSELSYVELYAGVGGWSMALKRATSIPLRCVSSLDHSDLCQQVYNHNNHRNAELKVRRIQDLSLKEVESWNADLWMMSPPCQPHTRQHATRNDLDDARSQSFLHLCKLLEQLQTIPSIIVVENVVGFEKSHSCQLFRRALTNRNYRLAQFMLEPTQVGLPNDRPRYYAVAVLQKRLHSNVTALLSYLDVPDEMCPIHRSLPETGISRDVDSVPQLATWLDNPRENAALAVPKNFLEKNAAWCFDIVTPKCRRTACFTSGYGKLVKGTGSILYTGGTDGDNIVSPLKRPEDRSFDSEWANHIDTTRLRYFSGAELGRLFGFDSEFEFPLHISVKQQWKLMGNSLNVQVASALLKFAIGVCDFEVDDGTIHQRNLSSISENATKI